MSQVPYRPSLNPLDLIIYQGDPKERILALASIANLRDVGGYTTAEGRQVKRGILYRSASLAYVTQQDLQTLNSLNIQLVCDLRTREESANDPDILPNGARLMQLPARSQGSRLKNLFQVLVQRRYFDELMPRLYTQVMLDNNPQVFSLLFRHLANADNLPLLVHCTAGKDRTGLSIALVLAWLGVDQATIIADYSLSNLFYTDFLRLSSKIVEQLRRVGIRPSRTYPLMIADPRTLQLSFEHLQTRYGGIEAYLKQHCHLDNATLQAVKDNLLI